MIVKSFSCGHCFHWPLPFLDGTELDKVLYDRSRTRIVRTRVQNDGFPSYVDLLTTGCGY